MDPYNVACMRKRFLGNSMRGNAIKYLSNWCLCYVCVAIIIFIEFREMGKYRLDI